MTAVALLTGEDYLSVTLPVLGVSLFNLYLFQRGRDLLAALLNLISFSAVLIARAWTIQSAFNLCFLGVILVIAGMVTNDKVTTGLFVVDLAAILAGMALERFTLLQPQDPVTGLYYANTVTVALPMLVLGYVSGLGIYRVLLGTIKHLQQQNRLLRQTQDRLIAQEKLASIQVLAGGIAHDFNNLLTTILGNLDILAYEEDLPSVSTELLQSAEEAVFRARDLTQQLLAFSRGNAPVKVPITDLPQLVREVVEFSLRGSHAKPVFDFPTEAWAINADRGQVGQVVQNLVLNARDAMPEGGRCTSH